MQLLQIPFLAAARRFFRAGMWLAGAVSLCGCTVFPPDEKQLQQAQALPVAYQVYEPAQLALPGPWWTSFENEELNRLVAQALGGNLTIRQAQARLLQAQALARQKGAALFPDLALEAAAGVTRDETAAEAATRENYGLGLAGSYEVDLWGRVRSSKQAAWLQAEASRLDRDTAAMTVAAEVVVRYFELLAQRESLRLLREQVANNQQAVSILVSRYQRGRATTLDVLQQKQIVAATESLIPTELAGEQTLRQQLAVLLGLPPQADLGITNRLLPELPPTPEAGVPLDLLARRPDVQAAEMRLREAEWQVGVARADRLPTLRLSASAGYKSDDIADLFDKWLANLAAGLAAPLVDGGRRAAEVDRTRAVLDERLAAYRAAVLGAVRDVQEALVQEYQQQATLEALNRQVAAAEQTQRESLSRYASGLETFLPVITAELSVQSLKRNRIKAHNQLLAYRVKLCRTLGGDWGALLREAQEQTGAPELTPPAGPTI